MAKLFYAVRCACDRIHAWNSFFIVILIIKLKLHPFLWFPLLIGIGAGMPLHMIRGGRKGHGKEHLQKRSSWIMLWNSSAEEPSRWHRRWSWIQSEKAGMGIVEHGAYCSVQRIFEAVVILIPLARSMWQQTKTLYNRDPSWQRALAQICVCSLLTGVLFQFTAHWVWIWGRWWQSNFALVFHSSCRNYLRKNNRK